MEPRPPHAQPLAVQAVHGGFDGEVLVAEMTRYLAEELCDKGFTSGYAEVRRLVDAGAVKVNGEPAKSWNMPVQAGDEITCGRRKRMVVNDRNR